MQERHIYVGVLAKRGLGFCSLSVLQLVKFLLPFRTFKTHPLVQLTTSLLQFEMIALRSRDSAVLSTWRV